MPARLPKRTPKLLTLLAALLAVTPALGNETLSLNFGVFSTDDASSLVRRYMPTLKALETSMSTKLSRDVDIRMHISTNQNQGTSYLSRGQVDFASLKNESYLTSKQTNPDVRILAAQNAMNSITLTPWVARSGMHDSVFLALRESMFELRNSKVLTSLKAFGFVQSHDSQYAIDITEHEEYSAAIARSINNKNTTSGTKNNGSSEPALLGAREAGLPAKIEGRGISLKRDQLEISVRPKQYSEE